MPSRLLRFARGLAASLGLALLAAAPGARATTLVHADLPALSRGAHAIVRATVASVDARWNADRSRIITEVRLEVSEVLKGEALETVILVQPGGVVGDVGQRVAGTPGFARGEDVLLFLERRGASRFRVRGLSQGKYRIAPNEAGELIAHPELTGEARVIDPVTREERHEPREPLPLERMRLLIFDALRPLAPLPGQDEKAPRVPVAPGEPR